MKISALLACSILFAPGYASGQEYDVSRRSYPFLGDHLVVQVQTEISGSLRVVRGERGRIEVAGRARDGFVGFGLAGGPVRQLRLSAVGGEHVEYLVVVPEHVHLSVQLPRQAGAGVAPAGGLYEWGGPAAAAGAAIEPLLPTHGGLLVLHEGTPPAVVDVPDLGPVRSLSIRYQGDRFRITASRPLTVQPGPGGALQLGAAGADVDIVVYVPWGRGVGVHGGGRRLVQSSGGRPTTVCSGVAVQEPTPQQIWLTFYRRAGVPVCG